MLLVISSHQSCNAPELNPVGHCNLVYAHQIWYPGWVSIVLQPSKCYQLDATQSRCGTCIYIHVWILVSLWMRICFFQQLSQESSRQRIGSTQVTVSLRFQDQEESFSENGITAATFKKRWTCVHLKEKLMIFWILGSNASLRIWVDIGW